MAEPTNPATPTPGEDRFVEAVKGFQVQVEGLRSDFKVFGEGLAATNAKLDIFGEGLAATNAKADASAATLGQKIDQTNAKLDQTTATLSARIDETNAKLGEVADGLHRVNDHLGLNGARPARRQKKKPRKKAR